MPTFCMNAYTLVGPTKRYPCAFSCPASPAACGVDEGMSAMDRGAALLVRSEDLASAGRLGDADIIARALSMVALIFARLRMIDGFWTRRSTSSSVIAATLATLKLWNASRKASRLPKTTDQLKPTSNTPRVSASNMAGSSDVRAPHTSSW